MSKKTAIKFEKVTKNFSLNKQKTFKEFFPAFLAGHETKKEFTALDNISFEIKKGETVGIIGPNGSGKSTILKLIAGVMYPTSGKVTVHGHVSPLIELGAGFHPELSGTENIYLNGSILGLSQKELKDHYADIVNFAELGEFINQPIKHYSSGMYMRLAFAVAVHTHPEILLVDEILAVGDTALQAKCFAKMEQFKNDGVTIVFVSHALEQVKDFCSKVIYINHSKIVYTGSPHTVIKKYLSKKK